MTIKFSGIEQEISKRVSAAELELIREYERFFKRNRSRLESIYFAAGDNPTPQQLRKISKLLKFEDFIFAELNELAGISIDKIKKLLPSIYEENYYRTGWMLERTIGYNLGFNELSREVLQSSINNPFLKRNWDKLSISNHIKSKKQILDVINDGFENGWSYVKTAKAFEESIYGTGKKNIKGIGYKTLRIVRTESHRVTNLSRNDALDNAIDEGRKLGITLTKVWDAKNTKDPRDNHSAMDGKPANEDGEFLLITKSGTELYVKAPGNTGIAGEDINCQCFLRVELDGLDKRGDEVEQNISFEEWNK